MYELTIENQGMQYLPLVEDEITWTTERQGSPGKLEFKVLKDDIISFQEGNRVLFKVDGQNVFCGYVWNKKRDKNQLIAVTAYDQMRYLKYKDAIQYQGKTASDVVRLIANAQKLRTGDIEDTGYVIAQRARDNETFLDIIYDALQLTFENTKKLYVLYDDFGRLTLKDMNSLRLDLVVGLNTAEDFDYSTGLDEVYNQVKLVNDKEPPYTREDNNNIKAWGLLQYFAKINEKTNGQVKADTLLELYNRKARSLDVRNALGDIRARAGCNIAVYLPNIGDTSIQNYMLIETATHTFAENEHWMNLKLKGRL
ncbi:MAG TPA: hydrolase [Syntrophomonas sp.]|nr:hydrolase [Syntrophomonas sp.]